MGVGTHLEPSKSPGNDEFGTIMEFERLFQKTKWKKVENSWICDDFCQSRPGAVNRSVLLHNAIAQKHWSSNRKPSVLCGTATGNWQKSSQLHEFSTFFHLVFWKSLSNSMIVPNSSFPGDLEDPKCVPTPNLHFRNFMLHNVRIAMKTAPSFPGWLTYV